LGLKRRLQLSKSARHGARAQSEATAELRVNHSEKQEIAAASDGTVDIQVGCN
jgi:hypothetical protein